MGNKFLPFIVTICCGLALFGISLLYERWVDPRPHGMIQEQIEQAQERIPEFSFTTLDGKNHMIRNIEGRVVIINFWATWCPPCLAEFPTLVDMTEKYPDRVLLVALSSDKSRADVDRFIASLEKQMGAKINPSRVMIAMDSDRRVTRDIFRIQTYPESILVLPGGVKARHIMGADAWGTPELQKWVATHARK